MKIKTFTLSIFFALTVFLAVSIGLADTDVRGFIAQDTNWTLDKSPYLATGSLIVKEGVTLTFEPGVTVNFKPNTALQVDGTLVARGTQEMPITFTAYQDKNPGGWGYILFTDKSTPTKLDDAGNYIKGSILEYVLIEYAGGVQDIGAAVRVNSSNLLVDHCTIRNSATNGVMVDLGKEAIIRNSTTNDNKGSCGIFVYAGTATITNNTITGNNGVGIWVHVGIATITNNTIAENNCGGISSSGTVIITNNTITGNTAASSEWGGGIFIYTGGTATITNNTITGNTSPQGAATFLRAGNIIDFSSNTVVDNKPSGTTKDTSAIYMSVVPNQFKKNAIYNNKTAFDIYYDIPKGTDMDATENYWGTTDEMKIGARIYDFVADASKGIVNFVPFLASSPSGPLAPTGLALTVLDALSVKLTWNANPESDVAGYKVYYDTDALAPYEGKGAKEGDSPIDVKKVTSYTLSGLKTDMTYYFVVTAYDTNGKESGFSNEVRSNSPPQKPSNVAPLDAAKDITLTPTLKSSPFSDADTEDTHKASQWQITNTHGDYTKPIYDSGADTKNLTSITVPEGRLNYDTTYYWRMRHQDSKGAWSNYSEETSFTTTKLPTSDVFTANLVLNKGINIISLPLSPSPPYTASTLAATLNSTIVIQAKDGLFDAYVRAGSIGTDFPIQMGNGYIVNLMEAKNFNVTGKPWGEPVPAAPSISASAEPWAFVIAGQIEGAIPDNGHLRITNLRTGEKLVVPISSVEQAASPPYQRGVGGLLQNELAARSTAIEKNELAGSLRSKLLSERTCSTGEFTAAFVDMSRRPVIAEGDEFTIQLIGMGGVSLTEAKRYIISHKELEQAYLLAHISARVEKTTLLQNYPNPFNPETWIPYKLASDAAVRIAIYDINGALVRQLSLGYQKAGYYVDRLNAAYWDGRNASGEKVASGLYFYQLMAGDFRATRRMVILK
jgi:parallel beta-helix repeat protein